MPDHVDNSNVDGKTIEKSDAQLEKDLRDILNKINNKDK